MGFLPLTDPDFESGRRQLPEPELRHGETKRRRKEKWKKKKKEKGKMGNKGRERDRNGRCRRYWHVILKVNVENATR